MKNKNKITEFSVEEKLKARSFVEALPDNAIAYMVNVFMCEHVNDFLPYTIKREEVSK